MACGASVVRRRCTPTCSGKCASGVAEPAVAQPLLEPGSERSRQRRPETRAHGASDADPQQQELFVLVAARLAAGALRRAGVRRGHGPPDDADARNELLLLAPSILVPCLTHDGAKVWNTLAIAQYLDEVRPEAGLLPADRIARAHCRSVCGEMNSGFANLRSALPMNLKARHPATRSGPARSPTSSASSRSGASASASYGGPCLFGKHRTMADAMFAPVVTRFLTYDVKLDAACAAYCKTIMAMPEMQEWIGAAKREPDDIEELDMDF